MIDSRSRERFEQFINEQIVRRVEPPAREALKRFAGEMSSGVDIEELRERDPAEVFATVFYAWQFMQSFDGAQPRVELFSPDFERHGWRSSHSAILVLCEGLPFVSESIRLELNRRELTIYQLFGSDFMTRRDASGALSDLMPVPDSGELAGFKRESLVYIEFSRLTDSDLLSALVNTLHSVIADVGRVVGDHRAMCARVSDLMDQLPSASTGIDTADWEEHRALLAWLLDNNLTFLGYGRIDVSWNGNQPSVQWASEVALGLLAVDADGAPDDLAEELADPVLRADLHAQQAVFFKSGARSRVHRIAYPDCIALNLYDGDGRLCAQHRILGLFTANVYTMEPARIPLVRRKFAEVVRRSRPQASSYRVRSIERIMEVLPRDELFQCSMDELHRSVLSVYHIQERHKVRVIIRTGRRKRFASVLVYWPRDVYHTELRLRVQALLVNSLDADDAEFTTFFSESVLVRTHFVLRLRDGARTEVDVDELESLVVRLSERWEDRLQRTLLDEFGEETGASLFNRFGDAFGSGYRDEHETPAAANDIRAFMRLEREGGIDVRLYRSLGEAGRVVRLRMRMMDTAVDLSSAIPVIENLGMRVIAERPYRFTTRDGRTFWVSDFSLEYALAEDIDVTASAPLLEAAFLAIFRGDAENDTFNKLIVGARMNWREAAVLRAYAKYLRQLTFPASEFFVASTLGQHLDITQALIELFRIRFDPALSLDHLQRDEQESAVSARILTELDAVERLNEDQVLRAYLALVRGTLRTNYFQPDASGQTKDYISFKIDCAAIPQMPRPVPTFEIFVYSPAVEGVHLRRGKVARGGLRWSDRREDFRTEVLGLVKAQQVKNAVIVPVGAKGGFVLKRLPPDATREAVQAEGIACYKTFIRAMLDITDNRVGERIVVPDHVVRHDEDDPYLVVAADKGTASFSDIANSISQEYGFWLGDAFASGGSVGYDHKKMGITARGAWVSVQRHFRERGVDIQAEEISVVGIGDMSGDVFGNGMLLSEHIRLVAAFNHLHIFIDPDPDAARSFVERQRLFSLPRSSWSDYDASLISRGGGVFSRSAKSIPLSDQMRALLDISDKALTPSALVSAILAAPVDLIWNGGIGTYFKSALESHADVGDKTNDGLRIDAEQVRAKVIGEGGNLGLTQLARVAFAAKGGACNTDFIDNSAGVDCSDHEVNIKILLNQIVAEGDMTAKQRAVLLEQMTEDVAGLVLDNNYRQTQAISIAAYESLMRTNEYRALINTLEHSAGLDRKLEYLPSDEVLGERRVKNIGLTRPELAVLICYVKGQVKLAIIDSDIPEQPFFALSLFRAFPQRLRASYEASIRTHRLRREIIATQITNDMVDHMGITFVERMVQSTQVGIAEIVKAYLVARDVFDLHDWWRHIESLDHQVSTDVQMALFAEKQRLLRLATRWFIRNRRGIHDPASLVASFREPIRQIRQAMIRHICGDQRAFWQLRHDELVEQGVPAELAAPLAVSTMLVSGLGMVEVAQATDRPVELIARVAFELNDRLGFYWLGRQITLLRVDSYWEAMARESYFDELDWQVRSILSAVSSCAVNPQDSQIEAPTDPWFERYPAQIERWRFIVAQLRSAPSLDYPMFAVMVRALIDLAQTGQGDEEGA